MCAVLGPAYFLWTVDPEMPASWPAEPGVLALIIGFPLVVGSTSLTDQIRWYQSSATSADAGLDDAEWIPTLFHAFHDQLGLLDGGGDGWSHHVLGQS